MSVMQAMYTGVTGLAAEGDALGVDGDNISNTSTVGYKAERSVFEDVLGHSITAGTVTALPGSGVKVASVSQIFTQGSLTSTGVSTDMALSGDGFFTMKGTINGLTGDFYTRNGETKLDSNGYLVNTDGMQVQGYASNGDGTYAASLSSIQVPTAAISPRATEAASITANLDSSADAISTGFDITDPSNTSNTSTSMTMYDSLGNGHDVDVYFTNTGSGWTWNAVTDGSNVGGTSGDLTNIGSGTLTFGTDGSLTSGGTGTISAAWTGANSATITLSMGKGTADSPAGTGLDGVTQFAGSSNISSQSQDGYASGDLSSVTIDSNGIVQGVYTNGQKLAVAEVAIAKFRSNDGLGRAGDSMWISTRDSGEPSYGTAGSGGRGTITSGSLESSNVDLSTEFVNLIAHQRAFQANSKTITTADDMLQDIVNLKR